MNPLTLQKKNVKHRLYWNYFKSLYENKHESSVICLKIASQYCDSWSQFSLVYPSGRKRQSIFFTWTLGGQDFKY